VLAELARYAAQQKLTSRVGYKEKVSKWTIVITEQGDFIHLLKEDRTYELCPHLEQPQMIAGGVTRSQFLVESLEVIAGLRASADAEDEKKTAKLAAKRQWFLEQLKAATRHEPLLQPCYAFLSDTTKTSLLLDHLKSAKARPADTASFRVGDAYTAGLTSWHAWWDDYIASLKPATGNDAQLMLCLATGALVEPSTTHGKISGLTVVGGQPSGTVLIGFDKDAFASYGLEQSRNAACSLEASVVYRDALNQLIRNAARPVAGSLYLHWYSHPVPDEDDLLDFGAFDSTEADERSAGLKARRLLTAIREGQRPDLLNSVYFVLQVSAVGGRIMVRDWLSGSFSALVERVNAWFDDLSLVHPGGVGQSEGGKFTALLMRLVAYRTGEGVRDTFDRVNNELPSTIRGLWRSILQGTPMPDNVASRALLYIRGKLLQDGDSENLDRIACAILKAWISRNSENRKGDTLMKPELNLDHPSPAYHAGRMMAVLAALQYRALGDVGAGVVQRYYAAASTSPALVLGRLVKSAQHHLNKLDRGLANWYEEKLAAISIGIGTNLPTTLSLEEQALFALGYYQQKAALNARWSAKQDDKQEVSTDGN
jgi:CRISPR-associated protein Csd1